MSAKIIQNNVSKLKSLGIIGDVRQALGAENGEDKSKDLLINNANSEDIIGYYSQWNLGHSNWGKDFIRAFKFLEKENENGK